MNNTQKILTRIIQIGSGTVLFVPLLVHNAFLFPFIHFKNVSFRVLVTILLVLTIWLVLQRGVIYGKENYLLYSWLGLLVVMMLAAWFGVNLENSWYSNYERMEGVITIVWLSAYLTVLLQVFRTKADWIWLLRASVLVAILVSLYGLLQKWGISNNFILPMHDARLSATIGNPAYFAGYILFHLFFIGLLIYWEESLLRKIFYILIGLFFLLIIYLTSTRGPILGLVLGIFIMAVAYLPKASQKMKIVTVGLLLMITTLGGVFYLQKDSEWIQKFPAFQRLANISVHDVTVNNRFFTWRAAWQSFLDKPILGWGPENFRYGFNYYYHPDSSEPWFDRAHNAILDYLNASGVIGLLAYMLVLGFAVLYLWKLKKHDYGLFVIGLGLLAAYFFQNLFVFDTLNTYLPLLVFFGIVGSFYLDAEKEDSEWEIPRSLQALKWPIVGLAVVLLVVINYQTIVIPAKANMKTIDAYHRNAIGDIEGAFASFQAGLAFDTYGNREITMQLIPLAKVTAERQDIPLSLKKDIAKVLDESAEKILTKNPDDVQFRMVLLSFYLPYMKVDSNYWEKSYNLLEPALTYSPNRLEVYYSLAQLHMFKGEYVKALELLQHTFTITNKRSDAYINMLNIYAQMNNPEKFETIAGEYMAKFELNIKQWNQLGILYWQVGLLPQAETILISKVINNSPQDPQGYVSLASIYKAAGFYQQAIDVLKQAQQIIPSFSSEAELLIGYLETEQVGLNTTSSPVN